MPDLGQNRIPCAYLPLPEELMSYRNLRNAILVSPDAFHSEACRYANFLWLNLHTARSILALCRAIYLKTHGPVSSHRPNTYLAYKWILANYDGCDFIGNPRISFAHQATRIRLNFTQINRLRAWALWYLTKQIHPQLPPDPKCVENPYPLPELIELLDSLGFAGEGSALKAAVDTPMSARSDELIY